VNPRSARRLLVLALTGWALLVLWAVGFVAGAGGGSEAVLTTLLVGVLLPPLALVGRRLVSRAAAEVAAETAETPETTEAAPSWRQRTGAVLRRSRAVQEQPETHTTTEGRTPQRVLPGLDPL